ncbi:MAG: 2-phosphosulfolactate phosphatase [Solirubrobacteraceae bacterium]
MIDVALTPADLRYTRVIVVVDVLRATSTITQALAAGYEQVLCADSVSRALTLRAEGRVLAGERQCVMPVGFDQGNSPLDAARCAGRELVLATTNGAPAIVAAGRCAPRVLLACLLNLSAVVRTLSASARHGELDLQIVCSGTDGSPALEDSYLAGRICAALPGPRSDAALIAEAVSRRYPAPFQALDASADAAVLRAAGLADDIACCAQESTLDLVPRVSAAQGGVAAVLAGAPDLRSGSVVTLRARSITREGDEQLDRRPHRSDGRPEHEPGPLGGPVAEPDLSQPSRGQVHLDRGAREQRHTQAGVRGLSDGAV